MTAESSPRQDIPRPRLHEHGGVQFRLDDELARRVLERVLEPTTYDIMRRRQGGFFYARIPFPVPYLPDGAEGRKRTSDDYTLRERVSNTVVHSRQQWKGAKSMAVHGLATTYLYGRDNVERVQPDAVSLQLLVDAESHEKIVNMMGLLTPKEEVAAITDYRLTPNVIMPVSSIEVAPDDTIKGVRDPSMVALASLQNVVTKLNDQANVTGNGIGSLELPATFYAPRR